MKITVLGASGFVGQALVTALQTRGDDVRSVSLRDPARAAEAVIAALLSPNPPRHLVLGRFGLDIARAKFKDMLRELDTWETTSLGADFPVAGAA